MDQKTREHPLRRRLRHLYDGARWVSLCVVRGTIDTPLRTDPPPGEVQFADRVSLAVRVIHDAELLVWFEPDAASAREIQRQCTDCRVFAPTGHLRLVSDD